MKQNLAILLLGTLFFTACQTKKFETKTATDANGFTYSYVTNDPQKVREYTLANGLKVYLSDNKDEPRLKTEIAVRAGSTSDPAETTGLAHYFEHLMFKGTTRFGTKNWEKEKPLLDEIEELFELHKAEPDPEKKKEIYKKIDSVSYEASKYAIPNEYDKMVSSIGASGTNAGTSWEYTVYLNDIPSNEFEHWLKMERERFEHPVIRLFHTELETVYEEYNRSQDVDQSRLFNAMFEGLFPNHPLGILRLGYPEDLKNPSIKNIKEFYSEWYVPNNMAILLSGDLNYDETIKTIDKYWGSLESKELPNRNLPELTPISEVVEKHVTGPDAEMLYFAYRFGGMHSTDRKYVTLADYILANSTAGLIDINLNQKQKVQYGGCGPMFLNDYGMHYFIGVPKQGQSLEEVRDLLLAQIDSLKEGKFDDWLMEAAINDMRLNSIRNNEGNGRIEDMFDAFVFQKQRSEILGFYDEMSKITKEELMEFVKANYKNNYVIAYKHTGPNEEITHMKKPEITPVVINRDQNSAYVDSFLAVQVKPVEPVFVDFDSAITTKKVNDNVEIKYIENSTNELFTLTYLVDIGKKNDLKLPLAVNYLPYLGTDKYSAEELSKEFFKLGIRMNVSTSDNRSQLSISGLEQNMEKGLELFEHVLKNVKADTSAYNNYVKTIMKSRMDAKLNPSSIRSALIYYGIYGNTSAFKTFIPEEELRAIKPEELVGKIKEFNAYPHMIFYYGSKSVDELSGMLSVHHAISDTVLEIPAERKYVQQPTDKKDILFVNYDKSQMDVILLSKGVPYDQNVYLTSTLFNDYYGSGMNSIIWQDIREAKALAYTAYAQYARPSKKENSFYLQGVVFTQADKMMEALSTMQNLLDNMEVNENSFEMAKQGIIKNIQTGRIYKTGIFNTWLHNQEYGIDHDLRKDQYELAQKATIEDIQLFFDTYIKDSKFTYVLTGNKANLDEKALKKYGNLKELSIEDVFGY